MSSPDRGPLENWITGDTFSCLAAKAAVRRKTLKRVALGTMGNAATTAELHTAVTEFVARDLSPTENFASLVVTFEGPHGIDEEAFEALLWQQLNALHDLDVARGHAWAQDVESDPESPHFAFSVAGHPFFVVGMHADASRISRRYPQPALAFNSHHQFDRLKRSGVYYGLQRRIREREERLQQSINPNLAEFGDASEARQYSGSTTDAGWRCPFHPRPRTTGAGSPH